MGGQYLAVSEIQPHLPRSCYHCLSLVCLLPNLLYVSGKPQWLPSVPQSSHVNEWHEESSEEASTTFSLLNIPAEVRPHIYGLVLAQTDCFCHSHTRSPNAGTALALLRVNRSIYDEARLLPFPLSQIEFQKWYGSSMFCCNTFLRILQVWQRREIRTLDLTVNGRELSGRQAREGWHQPCKLLRLDDAAPMNVRSMTLTNQRHERLPLGGPFKNRCHLDF